MQDEVSCLQILLLHIFTQHYTLEQSCRGLHTRPSVCFSSVSQKPQSLNIIPFSEPQSWADSVGWDSQVTGNVTLTPLPPSAWNHVSDKDRNANSSPEAAGRESSVPLSSMLCGLHVASLSSVSFIFTCTISTPMLKGCFFCVWKTVQWNMTPGTHLCS